MEILELYLSPQDAQRFQVIATRVPAGAGDCNADCTLPFWDSGQDWRRTIIKVLESSRFRSESFPEAGEQDWMVQKEILRPDRQNYESAYLHRIGEALYQSLFPPDSKPKSILQHSLRLVEQHNVDLHLRLKFAADSVKRSRLADYPWELLHDGQRFLLHQRVRLSRYIAYEASPPQLPAQEKVRVLLISARPQGLAQLTQAEQQAIQVELERAQDAELVQLQILPSPTRKALNRYLTDCSSQDMPQVLHFDGHGVFGKRCTNPGCLTMHPGIKAESCRACGQSLAEPQGYLAFETEQGKPNWQSATQVAAILQPYPIALVVLSACQSGMAVAGDSVFNGMAQNLIDQRIPAVVAMQYSVRADAACDFAEQFYRVLGKKEPLLTALNRGIREMNVEGNQWYRPVLYLRWQDNEGGQLFKATEQETSEQPVPPYTSKPDPSESVLGHQTILPLQVNNVVPRKAPRGNVNHPSFDVYVSFNPKLELDIETVEFSSKDLATGTTIQQFSLPRSSIESETVIPWVLRCDRTEIALQAFARNGESVHVIEFLPEQFSLLKHFSLLKVSPVPDVEARGGTSFDIKLCVSSDELRKVEVSAKNAVEETIINPRPVNVTRGRVACTWVPGTAYKLIFKVWNCQKPLFEVRCSVPVLSS